MGIFPPWLQTNSPAKPLIIDASPHGAGGLFFFFFCSLLEGPLKLGVCASLFLCSNFYLLPPSFLLPSIKMLPSPSQFSLLLVHVFLFASTSIVSSSTAKIGQGYKLTSIEESPDGGIIGFLQVKQKTSVYGPDIPRLQLYVK